jgi:hypothetical protein
MEPDHFDALARAVPAAGSRRRAVGAVLGGSLAALGLREAGAKKHKKNHKKDKDTCPPPTTSTCPPPPTPAFCAGKNECAQIASTPCATSGSACNCWMRQDNATSYCSVVATGPHLSCAPCTAGQICVVLGGKCSTGYGCVTPCPNPK